MNPLATLLLLLAPALSADPELAIAGRLVDADGAALKGWRVRFADPAPLDPGVRTELRTGAGGEFAFSGLSACDYTLLAWGRERGARAEQIVRSGPIAAGSHDVLLRAERNAGVRTLIGRVVDESGAGIFDARVGLDRVAKRGRWLAWTEPSGNFQIYDVPPGTLLLVAAHPGFLPQRIEIGPDARTDELTLRLSPWRPFRFVSTDRAQAPDRLLALGAQGEAELWSLAGDSPARIPSATLRSGRSKLLSVGPDAREIAVYRGLVEVARFPAPPPAAGDRVGTLLRWP